MAKVIASTKEMSRSEWLDMRSKYIGGSDAAVVLGISKWKTPFELWLEKTGQIVPEEIDNDVIHFGNVLEDVVAKEFERRTDKRVRRKNQMLLHDEHEFMMANIDREVMGEMVPLECKTTSAYNAKEWEEEEIPASYLIQVNHYMSVLNAPYAYIACLIGGQKFVWKRIERDEELIKLIIDGLQNFWEFHVIGNVPPKLDGSSAAERYLKERYSKGDSGLIVDLDSSHDSHIKEYLQIKETIKSLDTQAKEIENQIKLEMKEAETALSDSFQVSWKTVKSNRLDSKALKTAHPELYKNFCKETHSRRFAIKGLTE